MTFGKRGGEQGKQQHCDGQQVLLGDCQLKKGCCGGGGAGVVLSCPSHDHHKLLVPTRGGGGVKKESKGDAKSKWMSVVCVLEWLQLQAVNTLLL
jgi:hypothetical protein